MVSIWTLAAIFPALIVLWNVYIRTSKFHVLLRKIPGPTHIPVIGNGLEILGGLDHVLRKFQFDWPKAYGGIYRIFLGPDCYFVYSSQKILDKGREYETAKRWLGEGLLLSSGEKYKTRRKLLTPAFHFKILTDFMDSFNRQSRILCRIVGDKCASKPKVLEMYRLLTRASLDVICDATMGCQINSQTEESEYVTAVYRMSQLLIERMQRPWLINDFVYFLSPLGRDEVRLLQILHGCTDKVINARRETFSSSVRPSCDNQQVETGIKIRKPFLDLMLEVSDGGKVMSHLDIREEVDTFMFEGHDTTSSGLIWFLYNMAANPNHQEKVFEELRHVFGDDGSDHRDCTQDDFTEMKFLERCIKESLRMYPPVPLIERVTKDYVKIGNYTLPPGCNITMLTMATHMNPKLFPEPEKFDPDRFLPEECDKRHPYAYVPFSAGTRNCIGQKFAMMELKVVLSSLLRRFRFSVAPESKKPVPSWQTILKPLGGLNLTVTPRYSLY